MHVSNTLGGTCVAALGAMTVAIKAKRALAFAGIKAEVVALAPQQTRRGCAYGVEFSLEEERMARAALRENGISVSQYIRGG